MVKATRIKRILALAIAVCMMVGIFVGCGSSATTESTDSATSTAAASSTAAAESSVSQEPVNLQFWTISLQPTFTDFFNGLISKYQEDHKNITVQWTDMPYEGLQDKVLTSAASGKAPDVVNLNTELAVVLSGKDALVNLDKEATEEQKSIYIKPLFESTKTSKGIFAFPWYGSPTVMVYNKELFAKAGITTPPKTFDEMLTTAKDIKTKTGAYLFIPGPFYKILQYEGIPLTNEDYTKATFNTPEAVELLNKYKQAVKDNIVSGTDWDDWNKMLQRFSTGKLAMINSGPQTVSRIKDEAPNIYKNIEVAPSMVGKANLIDNPLMSLSVLEASKHHKEAIEFAVYITNDDNQLAFCKTVPIFPSTTKAAQDEYFKSDASTPEKKAISFAADMLSASRDFSMGTPKQQDLFKTIKDATSSVIVGNKDAKTAMDEAEKKANEVLARK